MRVFIFFILCISLLVVGGLLFILSKYLLPEEIQVAPNTFMTFDGTRYFHSNENGKVISFDLLDPEESPKSIHESVMLGYNILLETRKYAPDYTGNALSCTNCHFSAGNTLGGENGGISLAGVVATYPKYSARDKKTISLKERVQNCFLRSMNGKAPPEDSKEMNAIIAYLNWISSELKSYKHIPWLGLKQIKTKKAANLEKGLQVYEKNCASCHQLDGSGTEGIPPVWGEGSFNSGAGMNQLPMLSSFIYWNMPKDNASLNDQEALDVAGYIISQKRPKFEK